MQISPITKKPTAPVSVDELTGRLNTFVVDLLKCGQREVLQVTSELDLTLTQMKTLWILDEASEPLAIYEIAEGIGLSLPATGRAVDQMVRTGLATRSEDTADRRVKRVALTEAGERTVARIVSARVDAIRQFVAGLAPDERAGFAEALAMALERQAEQAGRVTEEAA